MKCEEITVIDCRFVTQSLEPCPKILKNNDGGVRGKLCSIHCVVLVRCFCTHPLDQLSVFSSSTKPLVDGVSGALFVPQPSAADVAVSAAAVDAAVSAADVNGGSATDVVGISAADAMINAADMVVNDADVMSVSAVDGVGVSVVDDPDVMGVRADAVGVSAAFLREFQKVHELDGLTTGEVCVRIVLPATMRRKCAFVDLVRDKSDGAHVPFVGKATVFVSHAWSCQTLDVFATMLEYAEQTKKIEYFWFDLFINNQHGISEKNFMWFCTTFKNSIASIGMVLQVMTPWNDPAPLKRAWCLWETFCALDLKDRAKLIIRLPPNQRSALLAGITEDFDAVTSALVHIDGRNAAACKAEDRNNIFAAIQKTVGFAQLNMSVKNQLREWYLDTAGDLAEHAMAEGSDTSALNSLATTMYKFGDYSRALKFYEKVLAGRQATLGESHLDTAAAYNNIATVHHSREGYGMALMFYDKALAIELTALGDDHPSTATTYNNMAIVYCLQGKCSKALEYHGKALAIKLSVFGDNHPDTATIYHNMAHVYNDRGQYDKALKHYNKALAVRLATLGKSHPDTAIIYGNIGDVQLKLGCAHDGRFNLQRAIASLTLTLGPNHPHTKWCVEREDPATAAPLSAAAAALLSKAQVEKRKGRAASCNTENLDIATTYTIKGAMYDSQGQYDKALECYDKALAFKLATLGKNHPDTAAIYNNIANTYYSQGQYEESLEYHGMALAIKLVTIDKYHISTANTYNNIGAVCDSHGQYDKALECHGKALAIRLAMLDKHHPSTADTYNNMANVYNNQGQYDKALEFYDKALAIRLTKLGENHFRTAETYNNMGAAYDSQGQYDKALEYHSKALAIKLATLGDNHSSTAVSYCNIGDTQIKMGCQSEGKASIERGLKINQIVLGSDHPETKKWAQYLNGL